MSPQITHMCEALLALTDRQGTFTATELIAYMGSPAQRSNLVSRLMRLVVNNAARITNEMAVASGEEALFTATAATVPYMHGNREAFLAACSKPEQPIICDVWGIRFPENWHSKRYPNAHIHKPRWE